MPSVNNHSGRELIPKFKEFQFSWGVTALFLLGIFLLCNVGLFTGATTPKWDAWQFYTPEFTLVADYARAGRFLLWDPWENAGSPDHANPQVGAASPIVVAIGAIAGGTSRGFRVYWFVIWFLGPLNIVFLARSLNAPPWAALTIALAYAFCGFYAGHAEHTTFICSFSFLPFVFWRLDVALRSAELRAAAEAGAAWGLSALSGYPSLTIMTGGFVVLWSLGRCCVTSTGDFPTPSNSFGFRVRLAAISITIFICVGVLVLAPAYFAFFTEVAGYSERAGVLPRTVAVSGQIAPSAILNFASPYLILLKYPGTNNPTLWPDSDLTLMALYMGILPVVLALFSIIHRPKSAWRWWLIGTVVFALACAVGTHLPIRGWLYDYCPPTRYFRHTGAFRAYAIFGVMMLGILGGCDLHLAATRKSSGAVWVKLFAAAVVTAAAAVTSYFYVISGAWSLPKGRHLANDHIFGLWLGFAVVSLVLLLSPRARQWVPVLLVTTAICDAGLTQVISHRLISGDPPSSEILHEIDARHQSNLDLRDNGLYRQLDPPGWTGHPRTNNSIPLRIATFYNHPDMSNRFHLDFAKHRIILNMGLGTDRIWFSDNAVMASPSDAAYDAFVKRTESLGAPILVVHPRAQMLQASPEDQKSPEHSAEFTAISQLLPARKISANVITYTPNKLEISVTCPNEGWALITDRWASGWRAKVDGHEQTVYGGDFIFRAVRVRAGENRIELYYSQRVYLGLIVLSWAMLVTVFIVLPIARSRRTQTNCTP